MPYKPVSRAGQAIEILLPLIEGVKANFPPPIKALLLQKDKLLEFIDTNPTAKGVLEEWIDRVLKAQI